LSKREALAKIGAASAILAAGAVIIKMAMKETNAGSQGVQPAEPEGLTTRGPDAPLATGGGGTIHGPATTTQIPGGVIFSEDPQVAIQQIKDLAEQANSQLTEAQLALTEVRPQTITTNTDGTARTREIFVAPDGKQYQSKQAVLDAFIKESLTPDVLKSIEKNTGVSVLEALRTGQPINPSAFITKRPDAFPEAKSDTAFLRRAQALQPTLTADNPGGSSNASVPNLSRLAAVGTDLSKVDIFNVQNKSFLGEIKSGQGPLTEAQKILVNAERKRIDPRNQTVQENAQISANIEAQRREAEKELAQARALEASGFTEAAAKAKLLKSGIAVRGGLTTLQAVKIGGRFPGSNLDPRSPKPGTATTAKSTIGTNAPGARRR
jgi:hypothetical protein